MSNTTNLALKDVKRKNLMMLIALSIAITGALLVSFMNGEIQKAIVYIISLVIIVSDYIFIHLLLKKYYWFSYFIEHIALTLEK